MYWNSISVHHNLCSMKLNSNIRCIEMFLISSMNGSRFWLNSNIRCIEIRQRYRQTGIVYSWIVTLDVLKYRRKWIMKFENTLNSNIRCIEILFHNFFWDIIRRLNSNIRCIEIMLYTLPRAPAAGWIVTLDVLKSFKRSESKLLLHVE